MSQLIVRDVPFERLIGSPIIVVADYKRTTEVKLAPEGDAPYVESKADRGAELLGVPYTIDVNTYTVLEVLRNVENLPLPSTLEVYPGDWRRYRRLHFEYWQRGIRRSPVVERYRGSPGVNERGRVILFLYLDDRSEPDFPTYQFVVPDAYESVDRKKEVLDLIRQASEAAKAQVDSP